MINPEDYGLDNETIDKAREFFKAVEAEKRKEKKSKITIAQMLKSKLSVEEKIQLLNTAYDDIPESYQAGMVMRPQVFNSVHMEHPRMAGQHESFGARLLRTRDMLGLSREDLATICENFAKPYDCDARKGSGRNKQRSRVTLSDIANYEDFNVSPKRDKLTVLAKALGVDIAYLTGYGEPTFNSTNEFVAARYRKNKKRYVKYTKDDYKPFADDGAA